MDSKPNLLNGIGINRTLNRYSIVRLKNYYYFQHSCHICFCFLEDALVKKDMNIYILATSTVSLMDKYLLE